MCSLLSALAIALVGAHDVLAGQVLRVGILHELKSPSAAARVARDGDTIEIEANLYPGDAAVWWQNNLTIRGVGGRPHLRADGAHAEGKAIWVLKGSNTTVENMEFSGAKTPDRNGAGIRQEGPGLTVRNSYFHRNENGILTGAHPESDIVLEHCEFAHNGAGDGRSHNLYIGTVRTFILRYSYVHRAIVGHNVKSRAIKNYIAYNRIMDEEDGRASYGIDLPDGGLSFVIGNLIQQGPASENRTIVAFGAEGFKNLLNELYFVNNTVVNEEAKGGRFVFVRPGASKVQILNNVFSGLGDLLDGSAEMHHNVRVPLTTLLSPRTFDYRLKKGSPAIGRGVDPGVAYGVSLRPVEEYVHKASKRPRGALGQLDAGALEYRPALK